MKTTTVMGVLALAGLAGAAQASIFDLNGYAVQYRIFNGYPYTNFNVNGIALPGVNGVGDPYPLDNYAANGYGNVALGAGPVSFRDDYPFPTEEQGFANKAQAMFSGNGGASPLTLNRNESFDLTFRVRLTSGNPLLRKEAGLVFFNPRGLNPSTPDFIDEGRVLIASNSFNGSNHAPGETAIFGASMPFTGGGPGGFPGGQTGWDNDKVVNGQEYEVRFVYYAPDSRGVGTAAAYEAFFDGQSSGLRVWGNEFDGTGFNDGTKIGFVAQFQRNRQANDFAQADYNLVRLIPTPGATALLGVAGLAVLRRRR